MKRVFPLFAVMLFLATFVSAEEWTKTFNLTGKPELRIDTSDADIRVDTWNQKAIEARVVTTGYKIGDGGINIIDRQSGNSIDLQVKFPHHHGITINLGNRSHRVEVIVRMPEQASVDLHTADGNIRLHGVKGDLQVKTGDGNEEIEEVDGHLRAQTSDGHIRVRGRFDELDLSTGDGRIEATMLPGSRVSQSWNVHSGDGSVHLEVPSDLAADLDLQTGDGHISVDVPITVSGQMGGSHVRGKLNSGGNLLTVHTGDGSIEVEKSSGTV
jgi:DUF4097 and DUF4098 domain-containing protein YvlB